MHAYQLHSDSQLLSAIRGLTRKTFKKFSRIDSSIRHSVAFDPDHIHRRLTHSQKNKVESSFTYGVPFADYKIILELVEAAEATLYQHEVAL